MALSCRSVLHSFSGALRSSASFSKIFAGYCSRDKATWSKFFKKDEQPEESWPPARKSGPEDGPSTVSRLESLKKKKEGLISVRGYAPPNDIDEKVKSIALSILGQQLDVHSAIEDRKLKFELLTRLMAEFDHVIPNTELNNLHCLDDVIAFFSTPVRDRSSYEDLAKLDLPPNLHIQMEPVRFNAETDTFFDGKTAFPGSATIVSSLKYRRKYSGNRGESKGQPNRTRYEETVMFSRKT